MLEGMTGFTCTAPLDEALGDRRSTPFVRNGPRLMPRNSPNVGLFAWGPEAQGIGQASNPPLTTSKKVPAYDPRHLLSLHYVLEYFPLLILMNTLLIKSSPIHNGSHSPSPRPFPI